MKIKIKDSKLLLKILSALAAVVLWFAITYTEDPVITQRLVDIGVVFEGEDVLAEKGLIVINKDEIPYISAVIRGNRSSVIASVGSVSAVADVSEISETGEITVPIKYNYPTSSVVLAKAKTKEITIKTEKIVTRTIPVKITQTGAEKNSDFIIKSVSKTENLRISGAESLVYQIACAEAAVDVSGITASGEADYIYRLTSGDGAVLSEENISEKSEKIITVENTAYKKISLPVKIVPDEETSKNFVLDVKLLDKATVTAGYIGANPPESLTAVYAGGEAAVGTEFTIQLEAPEGVYLPENSREITCVCTLTPKVLRELAVPVAAKNVPDGKKVKISPDKITVSVKGAENALSAQNITAAVDVSGMDSGDTAVLEVELSTDKEIEILGAYTASVSME